MTRRPFTRAASLALAAGLLVAGLWPLGFSPRNGASWASGGRGLYFDGTWRPGRLSVGGLAYSAALPGKGPVPDALKGSLTIVIHLQPGQERGGSVPRILSLADASGKEALVLGQYRRELILRWPAAKPGGGTTLRDVGVGDALPKTKIRWLAITSDQEETNVYVDGGRAQRFPRTSLLAAERSIRDYRIVLGNSPRADSPWTGAILDLALYDRPLGEDKISEAWGHSPETLGRPELPRDGLTAAYAFEAAQGPRVSDLSGNGNAMIIPARIRIRNTVLAWPDISSRSLRSLAKDMIANVFGFIPFGFAFLLWLDDGKRRARRRTSVFVIALGALFSLVIEVAQAFMPVRDSSMTDFLCNILGTLLGVLAYHLYATLTERRPSGD